MDPVTHNSHFRSRDLNSYLGRWEQADPIGYPDGAARYEALGGNPVAFGDPSGLAAADVGTCTRFIWVAPMARLYSH